jgi:hypothetical protein
MDDWITHVYGGEHTRHGPFEVIHHTDHQGRRYLMLLTPPHPYPSPHPSACFKFQLFRLIDAHLVSELGHLHVAAIDTK